MGAWKNAKDLLFDSNKQIVIASCELLANLTMTQTTFQLIDDGKCTIEIESIIALFINSTKDLNDKLSDKFVFATLTFIANTIELDKV